MNNLHGAYIFDKKGKSMGKEMEIHEYRQVIANLFLTKALMLELTYGSELMMVLMTRSLMESHTRSVSMPSLELM